MTWPFATHAESKRGGNWWPSGPAFLMNGHMPQGGDYSSSQLLSGL